MNIQQILALIIVAVAAVFLTRQLVDAVRSIVQNKAGCGGGCAKCAFAQPDKAIQDTVHSSPKLISLGDIQTLPGKNKNNRV